MEYFDLCSIDRKPLGRTSPRGRQLKENEYHLVVMAILVNKDDKVLLTRRSKNKIAAGLWECTAGSVLAGEKSMEAIGREVREEIGVNITFSGNPISEYLVDDAIFDIWTQRIDYEIEALKLQKEEVDEARYVTLSEIMQLVQDGRATKSLSEVIRLNREGKIFIREK